MSLVKPILSKDKYEYKSEVIKSRYALADLNEIIINGVVYRLIGDVYTCLNTGEIYLDRVEDKLMLMICDDVPFELISSRNSKISDIIFGSKELISEDIVRKYLDYLKFGKFEVIDDTKFILKSSDQSLTYSWKSDINYNDIPTEDIKFNGDTLYSITDAITYLPSITDINELISELHQTESVDDLISTGDIVDYVSLKTNVLSKVESGMISLDNTALKLGSEVKVHNLPINSRNNYSMDPVDSDNTVYWISSKDYITVERKIREGDLIKLVIQYKVAQGRLPVHYEEDIIQASYTDYLDGDPTVYYTEQDTLCKLNESLSGDIAPITFNGYHISFGNISEYIETIFLTIKDSYVVCKDKFIIQITEDSISLFPINKSITEYFISSCRLVQRS